MAHVFVGLPEDNPYARVSLRNDQGKAVRQVLWGDWLSLAEPDDIPEGKKNTDTWLWVRWAWSSPDPAKRQVLKIRREHTTSARPLEIIFVDVGQGDGAVLISPERGAAVAGDADAANPQAVEAKPERIMVIDAGKWGHMAEFLDKRFKAYREGFNFHAAIVTHPDHDHYNGFARLLKNSKIRFERLYHNGIVETSGEDGLARIGGTRSSPDGTRSYLQSLVVTDEQMRATFDPLPDAGKSFAKMMNSAIVKQTVGEFRMLGVNLGDAEDDRWWVPGFGPSGTSPYSIEILGPWVEHPFGSGDPTLRVFADDLGKTKNGHSVLLRLQFGAMSVLFGGDLNRPSEMFLLQQYSGRDSWPSTEQEKGEMIASAAVRLSSDVMKSCHHGSADVTDEFLKTVKPAAFVISSGDQDANYVHPRPDLLGRLGKFGKGEAPVLLSTELQRSTKEIDTEADVDRLKKRIAKLADCAAEDHDSDDFEDDRRDKLDALLAQLRKLAVRSVAVDGAIYVKTDGLTLMAAFKKETTDARNKWFYYLYRLSGDGKFELIPRESSH